MVMGTYVKSLEDLRQSFAYKRNMLAIFVMEICHAYSISFIVTIQSYFHYVKVKA